MVINSTSSIVSHVKSTIKKIRAGITLPFSTLLPEEVIIEHLKEAEAEPHRTRIFPPQTTVWTFLSQVTGEDQSCQNAVSQVIAYMAQSQSDQELSSNTSAYCQARKKLPDALMPNLTRQVAQQVEKTVPVEWKWRKRPVKLIDGTSVSMPDTQANQAVYPQQRTQKKGLGSQLLVWLEYYHLPLARY